MTHPTHGLDPNALEAAREAGEIAYEKAYRSARPGGGIAIAEEAGYFAAIETGIRAYLAALEPRASDRERTIEECAKVADGVRQRLEAGRNGKPLSQIDEHTAGTGDRIAAAIRKLSEVSHE